MKPQEFEAIVRAKTPVVESVTESVVATPAPVLKSMDITSINQQYHALLGESSLREFAPGQGGGGDNGTEAYTMEDEQLDGMALGELQAIAQAAKKIYVSVKQGVPLEAWMYKKITNGNEGLTAVAQQINNPAVREQQGVAENFPDDILAMAKKVSPNARIRGSRDEEIARRDAMLAQRAQDHANAPEPKGVSDDERASLEAELQQLMPKYDRHYQMIDNYTQHMQAKHIADRVHEIQRKLKPGVAEGWDPEDDEQWSAEDPKDEMFGAGDAYKRGIQDYRKFMQTKVKPSNPYSYTKQARQADNWEKGFEDGRYKQDVAEGSLEEIDRRGFLKGMGAAAVAGAAGGAKADWDLIQSNDLLTGQTSSTGLKNTSNENPDVMIALVKWPSVGMVANINPVPLPLPPAGTRGMLIGNDLVVVESPFRMLVGKQLYENLKGGIFPSQSGTGMVLAVANGMNSQLLPVIANAIKNKEEIKVEISNARKVFTFTGKNTWNESVEQGVAEGWSQKYKKSINCSHPRGFSQKAHCAGKKKHNESMMTMEATCPDCGMCQTHGNLNEIKKGQKDSNGFTKCWPGKHAVGTKKGKNGGQVRNCVPNESVEESTDYATRVNSLLNEMGVGSIASAPGIMKNPAKTGSLFGGSYAQKNSPFKKKSTKKESIIKR